MFVFLARLSDAHSGSAVFQAHVNPERQNRQGPIAQSSGFLLDHTAPDCVLAGFSCNEPQQSLHEHSGRAGSQTLAQQQTLTPANVLARLQVP